MLNRLRHNVGIMNPRKIENHAAAVALNYFAYNFIKIHRTLRVTPAMAAGVTNRLWDVAHLVGLLESAESKKVAQAVTCAQVNYRPTCPLSQNQRHCDHR